MPHPDYRTCKGCGRHLDEVGHLSWTRLCPECSLQRAWENNDGISTKTGPAFRRWRRQMAASVGGVLLDDARSSAQTGGHGSR